MIKVSHNAAKSLTLADAANQVATSKQSMIVTIPDGSVVKVSTVAPPKPAYFFKGRPVYTTEQLASMSPEELIAIGWIYPDESKWVDELHAAQP